jgi:transcription factor IIIB subunit 2
MLIDLADIVQLNVFKLGRTFKALNVAVPLNETGMPPVLPEDLIFRFATKLEFADMTHKVAEDAVRLVKRMSWDWMAMGRRPSGICGACLLMAARMNNFRRTIREVVYIVKVTNHTIQKRLDEFNETETSRMAVEDFLSEGLALQAPPRARDPPSFYRSTDEWKASVEGKRRERLEKRSRRGKSGEEDGELRGVGEDQEVSSFRADVVTVKVAPQGVDLSKFKDIEYPRDADGFIKPLHPSKIKEIQQRELEAVIDPALFEGAEGAEDAAAAAAPAAGSSSQNGKPSANATPSQGNDLDDLARAHDDSSNGDAATPAPKKPKRAPLLTIDAAWEADEADIEDTIEEIFNDPETKQHAVAYANAEKRARLHTAWALEQDPHRKTVSTEAEVGEDEFADDPEVQHCLLTPEETQIKELLWINQNKDWLRQQQEKIFKKRLEAERPKSTKTRKKRKRAPPGQAQLEPASTAAEAAVQVLKQRAFSSRINYDAIHGLFDVDGEGGGGGGAGASGGAGGSGDIKGKQRASAAGGAGQEDDDDEADLAQVIAEAQAAAGQMDLDEYGDGADGGGVGEDMMDYEEEEEEEDGAGNGMQDEEFAGGYEEDYGFEEDDGGEEY